MISAVNRIVSDSEVRKILIESLAFENSSSECKTVIGPLNTRPAPIEEWVRDMAGIWCHVYDANLIQEIISKSLRERSK